jgi:hypothetical protein
MSDAQAARVRQALEATGVAVTYRSFPDVPHSMHGERPDLFISTLFEWIRDVA